MAELTIPKAWPKTAKGLRTKAASVRLDAYGPTGGVGPVMLRAERLAERMEAEAERLALPN
jgi:hypothetical protein